MKFAVVGGDNRAVHLCSLLVEDGHRVHTFALEKAPLPAEAPKAGCLQGCLYGADCVVLPTPAERGGVLNAPFAAHPLLTAELISAMWPGQLLLGGGFSRDSALQAIQEELAIEDILHRRGFAVGNAAITAEGAAELLMKNSPRTLWRSRVLVTGWGKLAKMTALRLSALGAVVTVAARKEGDRAMALALGMNAVDFNALSDQMASFSFVVNTVPDKVITAALLQELPKDALLLELASAPGGFDRAEAEALNILTVTAPGLPGKCAPYTAAELIRDVIYDALKEREE